MKPILDWMVKVEKIGLENIPDKGGAILVGNHRSDMDPFVVASAVPRFISWVAAEYTSRIPIFKNLIKETGVIPMEIDGNVSVSSIKKLMHVLKSGDILGIFPEGHDYMVQSDFFAPMVKFHEGFATFAHRAKVPIVPFVIVPIDEYIESIPFPPYIRTLIGLPDEVSRIPNRVTYRAVKIIFCDPIFPDSSLPERENVAMLSMSTRSVMEDIQKSEGMVVQA